MLSLQLIRERPEVVREALRRRRDASPLDDIIALDERRRSLLVEGEALRARRNEVSRQLSRMAERPPETIAEMRAVGDRIRSLEEQSKAVDAELNALLLRLPNIPSDNVPDGDDEHD